MKVKAKWFFTRSNDGLEADQRDLTWMAEGKVNKLPSRLYVAMFFLLAVNFALWQPFVWWWGAAAALMLGFAFYGLYVLRRSKEEAARKSAQGSDEVDVD
ncbi:DUF4175 domain-containing protein [Paenarthrobacter aurescens]|uniref:Uncharacterized protein n=1 Tax=Paenarthrobacter aurescens TaxID=43663 RepID=A0A4Y3NAG7_PAEAU|nr:DUF4175 domain-containing protein [Paenarthrobacter aurescens]MDO6142726.1 hypothetical protein [Paenarthrobacter aurescens]MDO6146573.1 hypothetical protein [Paenarthrobacter aurescens]MDO6157818.1 hypothetical protein [Paenarthrobacter aurescens]MDO6161803.1 hypothetical protein [Paenarthrobacter aurescens]GEB18874.1 hypothetical protein AAU01_16290 [Paenarthrobacter aurescens]